MQPIVQFVSYDTENDVGGVSSWLRRMVPRLREQGIDARVDLFCLDGKAGVNAEWYRETRVPFRWSPWRDDTEADVRQCLAWLREEMPHVYIPNCFLPAYFAAAEARRCGVRTIGVLHSDDPFYWGVVDEFVQGGKKWRLDEVVVVSSFLQRALRLNAALAMPVHEIPYGVSIPQASATPPDKKFRMIYTGRLVEEQKRISDLTRAFCRVAHEHPGLEAWIVGAGPGERNVRSIVQAEGLEQRVVLKGRVEPELIHEILLECHAFVLLSDFEGTPVSLLEAMSVGLVPICLETRSGVGEVIHHMKNGLLVQNREDSFANAVSFLVNNRETWPAFSAAARQTIAERYAAETCIEKWRTLLLASPPLASSQRRPRERLKLLRRNPKFGIHDNRQPSPLQRAWNRLGRWAGSGRRKAAALIRPVPHK